MRRPVAGPVNNIRVTNAKSPAELKALQLAKSQSLSNSGQNAKRREIERKRRAAILRRLGKL